MARNTYADICYKCRLPVAAGTGHFEMIPPKLRIGGKRWRVQHGLISGHGRITCAEAKAQAQESLAKGST